MIGANGGTIHTVDEPRLRKCKIDIPAGALASNTFFELTPYHQITAMPAEVPDGSTALSGADFSSDGKDVSFALNADAYIALPPYLNEKKLDNPSIKLMEYIDGSWIVASGSGKLFDPSSEFPKHHLGPDPANPAQLSASHPWVYILAISNAT
ncbi:MAG: hypothetical protein IH899_11165, partial [Planctomycetes bacterium]|nr:hypothetical protein [Planctomycetota bacterium]